jgi:hypothetical protein
MSDTTTITLVLTGARAGHSVTLGNLRFVGGECALRGDLSAMGGVLRYMARVYQAFSKGSDELALHQGSKHGKADADTSAAGGQADAVSGDVHTDGPSAEAATAGAGTGAGDAPTEHGPEGDGHQDARLREAILKLDAKNPEDWTSDGRPRMDAVEKLYGSAGITRKDVESALPDFRRPQ